LPKLSEILNQEIVVPTLAEEAMPENAHLAVSAEGELLEVEKNDPSNSEN
jgi:hypothetical protein